MGSCCLQTFPFSTSANQGFPKTYNIYHQAVTKPFTDLPMSSLKNKSNILSLEIKNLQNRLPYREVKVDQEKNVEPRATVSNPLCDYDQGIQSLWPLLLIPPGAWTLSTSRVIWLYLPNISPGTFPHKHSPLRLLCYKAREEKFLLHTKKRRIRISGLYCYDFTQFPSVKYQDWYLMFLLTQQRKTNLRKVKYH